MAFPTSPGDGDSYTNANGTRYEYSSADDKWVIINSVAGVSSGATFPADPGNGDLHYLTTDEAVYVYDSTATAWIQIGGAGSGEVSYIIYLKDGCTVAQIQDAIDSLSSTGGGIVQLPAEIITITEHIDMKNDVWLRGCGREVTRITGTFADELVEIITQTDGCRISDIDFYQQHSTANVLLVDGSHKILFENLIIRSNTDTDGIGINFTTNVANKEIEIRFCHFSKLGVAYRKAMTAYDYTTWDLNVHHCTFDLTYGDAGSYKAGYTQRLWRSHFDNNIIEINCPGGSYVIMWDRPEECTMNDNVSHFLTNKTNRGLGMSAGSNSMMSNNIVIGYVVAGVTNSSAGGLSSDNITVL